MPSYDRDKIKELILKRLSPKVKKEVLAEKLEGLIDEYIEQQEFVKKNGASIDNHPTRKEMKWWFQDPPTTDSIEVSPGVLEDVYEISTDTICLGDKLALEFFKTGYKYVWRKGEPFPQYIKDLIELNRVAEATKNESRKDKLLTRISNIAMVGLIRYYHLERNPYFCPSQISRAIIHVRKALSIIDKIDKGEIDSTDIGGELSLFAAFVKKKRTRKTRKKTDD